MKIFEKNGYQNTEEVAKIVCDYVKDHPHIRNVVMASKTGFTIDIFMKTFAEAGVDAKFTIVTHCYGDLGPGQCEMLPEKRKELEEKGVEKAALAIYNQAGQLVDLALHDDLDKPLEFASDKYDLTQCDIKVMLLSDDSAPLCGAAFLKASKSE